MTRPSLAELKRRSQKPDHRRIGNWMARRISRPAALRVTWLIAPWGVSANVVTWIAWAVGTAAAAALAWGTAYGWLLGAALLELWYLLDHVDGQLARLRGTASLDGTQLDFLMHHTVHLLLPLGAGMGLFVQWAEPWWLLVGVIAGLAILLITLHHDARYKAFINRLEQVRGTLLVVGGGGGVPQPQPPIPRQPLRLAAWTARKLCEIHVMMNLLGVVAVAQWLLEDKDLRIGGVWLGATMLASVAVAGWTILRSQRDQAAEREFGQWFHLPPGCELVFEDGFWTVRPKKDGEDGRAAAIAWEAARDSS